MKYMAINKFSLRCVITLDGLLSALFMCVGATEELDLGKKISIPQDVMMEELKLMSNRGSRMFHERLKRVERFTVENANTQTCVRVF